MNVMCGVCEEDGGIWSLGMCWDGRGVCVCLVFDMVGWKVVGDRGGGGVDHS